MPGKQRRATFGRGVVDNLATQMVEMVAINDVGRIGCRLTTPQNGVIEHGRLPARAPYSVTCLAGPPSRVGFAVLGRVGERIGKLNATATSTDCS